jgi:hypothetical protein
VAARQEKQAKEKGEGVTHGIPLLAMGHHRRRSGNWREWAREFVRS